MKGNLVLWFTGLSGAGKSTLAGLVAEALSSSGHNTTVLDGDVLRRGLCSDLGYTDADRSENIRRVTEVAKLMSDSGLVVLVATISPFKADRDRAREIIGAGRFIEIFVDAPLNVTESRDVKGLYRKARAGQLPNFTGIGSAYEVPDAPAVHVQTAVESAKACAAKIMNYIQTVTASRDCKD